MLRCECWGLACESGSVTELARGYVHEHAPGYGCDCGCVSDYVSGCEDERALDCGFSSGYVLTCWHCDCDYGWG
jgi:hypothetical protein